MGAFIIMHAAKRRREEAEAEEKRIEKMATIEIEAHEENRERTIIAEMHEIYKEEDEATTKMQEELEMKKTNRLPVTEQDYDMPAVKEPLVKQSICDLHDLAHLSILGEDYEDAIRLLKLARVAGERMECRLLRYRRSIETLGFIRDEE